MQKKEKNSIKRILTVKLLVFCLFLAACAREVLYHDLNQEDANKVIVLLQQNGIEATLTSQVRQNETFWSVKVDKEILPRARELVVTGNVISQRAPGLKEVYQGKGSSGWIKTPAEERARYLLATKGEVINSLKKLPEVIDADVVLNVPQGGELGIGVEPKRPTASVVIRAQLPQSGPSSLHELKIQEFVANTVEGLSPRDVSVLIERMAPMGTTVRPGETITLPRAGVSPGAGVAETTAAPTSIPLMGLQLEGESRERLKVYLIVFFAVLVILSVALIVSIMQASRVRQELKALKGGERHAIEGQVLEGENPRLHAGTREKHPEA